PGRRRTPAPRRRGPHHPARARGFPVLRPARGPRLLLRGDRLLLQRARWHLVPARGRGYDGRLIDLLSGARRFPADDTNPLRRVVVPAATATPGAVWPLHLDELRLRADLRLAPACRASPLGIDAQQAFCKR